ncbi:MAG: peptidoglycan-binding protein [Clostridia bacterium]|nr:peptidoglycan-binding protein [Clostridia bacterium]
MADLPFIPETIVVHLGPPTSDAPNVTVSFPDYIKNVASSEIFPTWPESALRANILAQISFALNRIYTEWYPSRGYDFDITNSTAFDQSFVQGRDIFDNISLLVDELFNDYVRRQGSIEPYFTQYCNGTTSTCNGLSQWGTVPLAEQGLNSVEILRSFYGDDIEIVTNAPVRNNQPSYPGTPLSLGDNGNDVLTKQIQLNRISRNYPAIPKITPVDGVFGTSTEDAVVAFQEIFGLTPDGIIGKETWYRIAFLYSGVKRLAELDSEGISLEDIRKQFAEILRAGDTGDDVRVIQYFLAVVGTFNDAVPSLVINGVFDAATVNAVTAFQQYAGLTPDGIVGERTWDALYAAYRGIIDTITVPENRIAPYPGTPLTNGSSGEFVMILQTYLNRIAQVYTAIPTVTVDGIFGNATEQAVLAFQNTFGLSPNGVVGPITWDRIGSLYEDLAVGAEKQDGQFGGYEMQEEVL